MPNINLKAPAAEQIIGVIKSLEKTTINRICERSSFARSTISLIVKELHTKKEIHITGWEHQKNVGWIKIYAWGKGVDLPEPQKVKLPKEKRETLEAVWPQCDIAANWMRNPI